MRLMPIVPVFTIAVSLLAVPSVFSLRGRYSFVSIGYTVVAVLLLLAGKL